MDTVLILKIAAALLTAATGMLALIKPSSAYGFTGLNAEGPRGVSEIRAIFGGLFISLGLVPFFLGPTAYVILGYAYLAIALSRLFSIIWDRSYARSNWISLGIEVALGVILVL
jgi:hypothetical protein